jgi:hypothetical protein
LASAKIGPGINQVGQRFIIADKTLQWLPGTFPLVPAVPFPFLSPDPNQEVNFTLILRQAGSIASASRSAPFSTN